MMEIKIAMPCARCGTETKITKDMAGNIAGVECPKCADKLEGLSNCMHTYGFEDIDEFISAIITNNLLTRGQDYPRSVLEGIRTEITTIIQQETMQ